MLRTLLELAAIIIVISVPSVSRPGAFQNQGEQYHAEVTQVPGCKVKGSQEGTLPVVITWTKGRRNLGIPSVVRVQNETGSLKRAGVEKKDSAKQVKRLQGEA